MEDPKEIQRKIDAYDEALKNPALTGLDQKLKDFITKFNNPHTLDQLVDAKEVIKEGTDLWLSYLALSAPNDSEIVTKILKELAKKIVQETNTIVHNLGRDGVEQRKQLTKFNEWVGAKTLLDEKYGDLDSLFGPLKEKDEVLSEDGSPGPTDGNGTPELPETKVPSLGTLTLYGGTEETAESRGTKRPGRSLYSVPKRPRTGSKARSDNRPESSDKKDDSDGSSLGLGRETIVTIRDAPSRGQR